MHIYVQAVHDKYAEHWLIVEAALHTALPLWYQQAEGNHLVLSSAWFASQVDSNLFSSIGLCLWKNLDDNNDIYTLKTCFTEVYN